MVTSTHSQADVEEQLQTDIAIWKSQITSTSRPVEYVDLVEGASIRLTGKSVATISIGKLEWELTPPSGYLGYCEKKDDWLLMSGSEFRVAVRSPHGRGRVLQVCPCCDEVARQEFLPTLLPLSAHNVRLDEDTSNNKLEDFNEKLNNLLTQFFGPEEAGPSTSRTLQRPISQKKRAEIIGKKFRAPFVRCVSGLQNAKDISDVLDSILEFSAAFSSNLQAPEELDLQEGTDENRHLNDKIENCSSWIRQQVRDAAMKCQVAAEVTSEVAKAGAKILNSLENHIRSIYPGATYTYPRFRHVTSDDNPAGGGRANVDDSSLGYDQEDLGELNDSNCNLLGASPRTDHSFGSRQQGDVGNDAFSESSWEFVRRSQTDQANDLEDEEDVLGANLSDAENLNMMLRGRDPFGNDDCSPLITEFLSLSSSSAPEEQIHENVQERRRTRVLERLASWSSSNSDWSSSTDHKIHSSASLVSRIFQTVPLETLAKEPACDPKIASICRPWIERAATEGNVLQWCSCKFNKSRSSIELNFQVGSFMEDDIATLSTGISHASPLRIRIFVDSTNVRQSLLEGNVRVSTDQGHSPLDSGVSTEIPTTRPVVGLSCYIPHLVRQYLKTHIHEQCNSGHEEFPDGELLTGLMKHLVAQLVFLRDTCCVCNQEHVPVYPVMLTSIVPRPCEKNLCQALFNLWMVVAPPMVSELSVVEFWLRAWFQKYPADEALVNYYMEQEDKELELRGELVRWKVHEDNNLQRIAHWITGTKISGSWLQVIIPRTKPETKLEVVESRNREEYLDALQRAWPAPAPAHRQVGYTVKTAPEAPQGESSSPTKREHSPSSWPEDSDSADSSCSNEQSSQIP